MDVAFKQKVHQQYSMIVQDKIDAFRDMISALSEDARNDAKGSAGDKHETALSMMHIEQEKINVKLSEFIAQKAVLDRIDPLSKSNVVALGSLVIANGYHLYLCAALPKITVDGISVIALSPQSPLGEKLMGETVGCAFKINGTEYKITEIT